MSGTPARARSEPGCFHSCERKCVVDHSNCFHSDMLWASVGWGREPTCGPATGRSGERVLGLRRSPFSFDAVHCGSALAGELHHLPCGGHLLGKERARWAAADGFSARRVQPHPPESIRLGRGTRSTGSALGGWRISCSLAGLGAAARGAASALSVFDGAWPAPAFAFVKWGGPAVGDAVVEDIGRDPSLLFIALGLLTTNLRLAGGGGRPTEVHGDSPAFALAALAWW